MPPTLSPTTPTAPPTSSPTNAQGGANQNYTPEEYLYRSLACLFGWLINGEPVSGCTRTSCISGEAELVDVGTGPVRVADVAVGQRVLGVGEDLAATTCEVVAVGSWGNGTVRGNFTL